MGPQIQLQKMATMTTAVGDRPVLLPYEHRLQELPGHALGDDEKTGRPERDRPAWIDSGGERDGKHGGGDRSDIGNKSQQRGEKAPKHRARQADEKQTNADKQPKACIDRGLGKKIPGQALRCVVDGESGSMKIVRAEEPYQPIPKILLPDEYEYRDDENDRERCEGRENWLQNRAACFEIAGRRRFDDDRHRRLFRRGVAERAMRWGREFVQRAETTGHLCDQVVHDR